MDPALKAQLEQLLAALLQNAQDAAAWTKEEIPLLVREKIAFGRAWETVMLLLMLVGLYFMSRVWQFWKTYEFDDDENRGTAAFGLGVGSVILIGLTIEQLKDVMQVWFAPRLYIVDWLLEMVKTGRLS